MPLDRDNRPLGFAIADCRSVQAAEGVVARLHNSKVNGRSMFLRQDVDAEDLPPPVSRREEATSAVALLGQLAG